MMADSSPRFPLARKIGTAFRLLSYGPEVFWLGLRSTIGMPRKLPRDGLVRVGKQLFRPADAHTADALLSGLYEAPERFAAQRYIRRDVPVVEFGGSLGVVACFINDRQSNRKNHVVVEANPQILSLLTENRDRNGCEFEIVHGAVGEQGRSISIHLHENALLSSAITTAEKKVEVSGVTLEDILRVRSFDRCALICDIEGAEVNLIRDELPTLRSHVETFIVEFHPWINGQDLVDKSLKLLQDHGFEVQRRHISTFAFRNKALA